MSHFYETDFEIGGKTVLIFCEYTLTGGCPAHYGDLNYPGHPAEPAELEFSKIEINTTDADSKTAKAENFFDAPEWIWTILSNSDAVYQHIVEQHSDEPDYSYEYEDR